MKFISFSSSLDDNYFSLRNGNIFGRPNRQTLTQEVIPCWIWLLKKKNVFSLFLFSERRMRVGCVKHRLSDLQEQDQTIMS